MLVGMGDLPICEFCSRPFAGSSCLPTAVVEGVEYHRIADPNYGGENTACHDCATPRGGFHHAGCDMERCPRCLAQAIVCGCRWAGDGPENAEHPDARRVVVEKPSE